MGALFNKIREAVAADRFFLSHHADEQLRERGMVGWQIAAGLATGRLLRERPRARPNPVAEVEQELADGTSVKAVWAYVAGARVALLVTIHSFNP